MRRRLWTKVGLVRFEDGPNQSGRARDALLVPTRRITSLGSLEPERSAPETEAEAEQ